MCVELAALELYVLVCLMEDHAWMCLHRGVSSMCPARLCFSVICSHSSKSLRFVVVVQLVQRGGYIRHKLWV